MGSSTSACLAPRRTLCVTTLPFLAPFLSFVPSHRTPSPLRPRRAAKLRSQNAFTHPHRPPSPLNMISQHEAKRVSFDAFLQPHQVQQQRYSPRCVSLPDTYQDAILHTVMNKDNECIDYCTYRRPPCVVFNCVVSLQSVNKACCVVWGRDAKRTASRRRHNTYSSQ